MAATTALQRFIEGELSLSTALFDQVVEDTLAAVLKAEQMMRPSERAVVANLVTALRRGQPALAAAFTRSLHSQVTMALEKAMGQGGAATSAAPAGRKRLDFKLVDEAEIAADVEMSHCTESIKTVAEFELRELETFTAALAGDMDMRKGHNPLQAAVFARALWAAALELQDEPGLRVGLMRHGTPALARALRKFYAAASSRLEEAGIEPAAYRTVIVPAGAKVTRQSWTLTEDALREIASDMQAAAAATAAATAAAGARPAVGPPGAPSGAMARPSSAPAAAPARAPAQREPVLTRIDITDLLNRLFEALLADQRLTPPAQKAIKRLQSAVLRLGETDPSLLEAGEHPAWRFLDRLAWQFEVVPLVPEADRLKVEQFIGSLLDHITGSTEQNNELYTWGLNRLVALERHRFESRRQAAAGRIAELEGAESRLMAGTHEATTAGALDTVHLDTLPAPLSPTPASDTAARSTAASAWLAELTPGDHASLFIDGHWITAQLLWHGPARELWLWADVQSDALRPVRRGALLQLHRARLATELQPRPLARIAARLISTQIARARQS